MSESRISKAVKSVNRVSDISWDKNTKMAKVSFNSETTSLSKIEMAVAKAGHDTQNHTAQATTYDALHPY